MDRQSAWQLLTTYTKNESLLKHALGLEAAMRAYASKFGEDEELWGVTGLLHDFDYELHPTAEEHPAWGKPILEAAGYPPEVVYAIQAHGDHTGLPRRTRLDKTLYAVDELVGFIVAVALVRPTKSIFDVEAPSVRKKMKDKAFARAVNREEIVRGAAELGVDLDEHITLVIQAMQGIANELGLQGQ
jgi:putative nucleotidyltransferase with HDIG domain